jgi:hypothetical protein
MQTCLTIGNRLLTCLLMMCTFLEARQTVAQDGSEASLPLVVGDKVRVLAPTVARGRIQGKVIQTDKVSLVIGGEGRTRVSLPRDSITQLDVLIGRHRQTLPGLWIGAGIGAVLWGTHPCVNEGCASGFSGEFALYGAVSGGFWGAVVGSLVKRDHWRAVPLNRLNMMLMPMDRGGVGVSVSISLWTGRKQGANGDVQGRRGRV